MSSMSSGQQLSARFTLRERLSAGALGETWRAHDAANDSEVVVKLLRPEIAAQPAAAEVLHRELETTRVLDHPAIARVQAVVSDGPTKFLVRPFIPGTDLAALRGRDWGESVPAAVGVAEALAAMHARGFVHRDLKSSNVVLRPDGAVILIDLGAAAPAGDATTPNAFSPYSASPQQLLGEPPSAADDAYAFGVLLYELLSGYPPFYPNITRERVLEGTVPPLRAAKAIPPALGALVMRLLAKRPDERPADLARVATDLRDIVRQAIDAQPKPSAGSPIASGSSPAALVRPIVRVPNADRGAQDRSADHGVRNWLIGGAFTLLAAVAAVVIFYLPRVTKVVEPPAAASAPVPGAAPTEAPASTEPVDLRALAEELDKAEQVQGAFRTLYDSLEKRAAAQWAAQDFAAAKASGDEAEKKFATRAYSEARADYSAGLDHLRRVADNAAEALTAQLAKGSAALAAGQSLVAQEAFELALKIDPQNAAAGRGLKRAEVLDQVVALVTAAANDERAGKLASAAQQYEQAVKLDPETVAARDGLARVQGRVASDEFAAAMSLGLRQLEAGKLTEARTAFERAGRLRPGAPEVNEGLARIAQLNQQHAIASHRAQAEQFERQERWGDALAQYQAALTLDPALEFALAGRDRTAPRLELARQLETLNSTPERLLSAAVREQARLLLAEARKVTAAGPVLRQQSEKLAADLARFETPVRVTFESDNLTEVVIFRVGKLGLFDRREMDLLPGTYTVVGTRAGFRDVRRELTVLPGQASAPLRVRCEDPI
jgi:tetratricopeptide (TPR) repeat protein